MSSEPGAASDALPSGVLLISCAGLCYSEVKRAANAQCWLPCREDIQISQASRTALGQTQPMRAASAAPGGGAAGVYADDLLQDAACDELGSDATEMAQEWLQHAAPSTLKVASSTFFSEKILTSVQVAMGPEYAAWAKTFSTANQVPVEWQALCLSKCVSSALEIVSARSDGADPEGGPCESGLGPTECAELKARLLAWQHVIEHFQVSSCLRISACDNALCAHRGVHLICAAVRSAEKCPLAAGRSRTARARTDDGAYPR